MVRRIWAAFAVHLLLVSLLPSPELLLFPHRIRTVCYPARAIHLRRNVRTLDLALDSLGLEIHKLSGDILYSIGCVVLYTGQGKFHSSTYRTMDYVVGQANFTVENLRNFSDSLSDAKKITVDQVLLPSNVRADIDVIEARVNSSATQLADRTSDNSRKIRRVLDRV